jgi:simple sugar transport system ATP-binding protein
MKGSVPLLRVEGLSKSFGAIRAVHGVSFELERGKILGLVGDNGAGKSTLLNMLFGRLQPTGGKIFFEGEAVHFRDPSDAMRKGVAIAYQFLDLVDIAPLWANFFMGRELTRKVGPFGFLDKKKMQSLTEEKLAKYGFKTDVNREVRVLSGGQRHILAMSKAIETNPKLLLLDEPLTGLSERVNKEIKGFLMEAKEEKNTSVIFATPWFDQISDVIDEVMVLARGDIVGHFPSKSADRLEIFRLAKGLLH